MGDETASRYLTRSRRALVFAGLLWLGVLAVTQLAGAQTRAVASVFTEVEGSPFVTDPTILTEPGCEVASPPASCRAQPHDVAFSPDGKFLVAANYTLSTITVFRVGPNGSMTQVDGSPFSAGGLNPNWLGFTPSGNFLAVVNIVSNDIVMFHFSADGTLTQAGQPTVAGPGAHAYWGAFSPSGALLAVANANFAVANTPGTVSMFHVSSNGTLTPVEGSPFATEGRQAQAVAFARGGTLLAAANRASGTVTMFEVSSDGRLSLIEQVLVGASPGAWNLTINPDNSLLVTANAGPTISLFHIDLATGRLGPPKVVQVPGGPRGVEFSPGGTLLATANFDAGTASVFSVGADGTLTEVSGSPYAAGPGNKHSVFSPNGSLFATANYEDDTVSVFESAPLTIRKTTSEGTPRPGGRVEYTITVHNARPEPVTATVDNPLVVDDLSGVLDKATLNPHPTATKGTVHVDHTHKTLTWVGTLETDETVTIHYSVTVHEDARGVLHDNLIGVPDSTCTSNEGGMLGPECNVENEIEQPPPRPGAPSADLSVSKAASAQTVHPGGQVQYTLTVRNHGPDDATGVTLEDPVPAGLFLHMAQPSQGSCTVTPREAVRCRLGNLPAGGQALVLVTATAALNATGTLVNRATVFGDQGDPHPRNNSDDARVRVDHRPPPTPDPGPQPVSDLAITKHVSRARARVGQKLNYTITVVNRSPGQAAAHVRVTDTSRLPLEIRSIKPSHGSCGHAMPFHCTLGTVEPGGRVTIRITATARMAGRLINAAAVTTTSWQSDPRVARARTIVHRPPSPPRFTG